jgi:Flp pilus assembly protein TadD
MKPSNRCPNAGGRPLLQARILTASLAAAAGVALILAGCGASASKKTSSTGDTAAGIAGDPIAATLLHVRDLLDAGQADSAAAVLRPQVIASVPLDPRLARAMVTAYDAAGLHREAVRMIDDLILLRPGDVNLHAARGEIELKRHRPEVAVRHFQRAILLDESSPEAMGGFGRSRAHTGGAIEPALTFFDKLIRAKPTIPAVHYGKAVLLLESGRVDEAVDNLRWVVGLYESGSNEGMWQAEREYGRALVRLSNRTGAVEHFEKAVRLLDEAGDPLMAERVAEELREAAEGAGDGSSPPGGDETPPVGKEEPQG